jgi:hypothetical protein
MDFATALGGTAFRMSGLPRSGLRPMARLSARGLRFAQQAGFAGLILPLPSAKSPSAPAALGEAALRDAALRAAALGRQPAFGEAAIAKRPAAKPPPELLRSVP